MNAKQTMVILISDGTQKEFPFEQAERILRHKQSAWALPKESEYEFNGKSLNVKRKADSGKAKGQTEKKDAE